MIGDTTGRFATSRRSMGAEDVEFVVDRLSRKTPVAQIARMTGRPASAIQQMADAMQACEVDKGEKPAAVRWQAATPPTLSMRRSEYAGAEVLSLFRGVFVVPQHLPTMLDIASGVAERWEVSLDAMRGPGKATEIVVPRQEAMSAMVAQKRWSLPQIGRFFARDHTTVLHGDRRHKARAAADARAMGVAAE